MWKAFNTTLATLFHVFATISNISNATAVEKVQCQQLVYVFSEDIPCSVFYILLLVIGVVFVTAGYRIYYIALFIQIFSIVSIPLYNLLIHVKLSTPVFHVILAGLLGTTVAGVCSMVDLHVGYIFSCSIQSLLVTTFILYGLKENYSVNILIIFGMFFCIFIMLFILHVKFRRTTSILFLTSYGSIAIMVSLDYFINMSYLLNKACANIIYSTIVHDKVKPCWYPWRVLVTWPVCMICSIIQFKWTAKHMDHRRQYLPFKKVVSKKIKFNKNKSMTDCPPTKYEDSDSFLGDDSFTSNHENFYMNYPGEIYRHFVRDQNQTFYKTMDELNPKQAWLGIPLPPLPKDDITIDQSKQTSFYMNDETSTVSTDEYCKLKPAKVTQGSSSKVRCLINYYEIDPEDIYCEVSDTPQHLIKE